ncbi:hypothetical protein [Variovorax paradoxus]|nr:hypothetical protein RZE77_20810 [Variovorax paradoxus]
MLATLPMGKKLQRGRPFNVLSPHVRQDGDDAVVQRRDGLAVGAGIARPL